MRAVPVTWLVVALCLGGLAAPVIAAEEGASSSDRLEQRVRRLENILDSDQIARLLRRINALEREMRELRGEIETQGHRLGELRKRQRSLYGDLDRRLRELEIAATRPEPDDAEDEDGEDSDGGAGDPAPDDIEPGDAPEAGAEGDADTDGDQGGGESGGSAAGQQEAYESAFSLLRDGRYGEAAEAFGEFIERHPRGPYADNAQYWLGEAHYVTRDFEAALAAFRQTVEEYDDSSKVPDARLKIGYTLDELGRPEEARAALQQVMSEHPESTVARLAEERLLELEGND